MRVKKIIDAYILFFEKNGHKRITNSPLVPIDDPTTLFTSSGMQPLIPYLLGEPHPQGKRLVNIQNSFRAVDIDEVGDNRHTTFFRMLGNWSLGDYFKNEEIPWLWEFLTVELKLPEDKLFITVFGGEDKIAKDTEAFDIWKKIVPEEKIFFAGVDKNWWSRSGVPENMPVGEIGGPDTEVYFRFDDIKHNKECKDSPVDCVCGKFLEIANSVFMQYIKTDNGFKELPNKNVDFGGGLERLLAAVEEKSDIFKTSLFSPIIKAIEKESGLDYEKDQQKIRIVADHLRASVYLIDAKVIPSNKERGYILRRLIRRALDNLSVRQAQDNLGDANVENIVSEIVAECSKTDESLKENYEEIKNVILEEQQNYKKTIHAAEKIISSTPSQSPSEEDNGVKEISADEAFKMYSTHGLSPTQIKSLGYIFDEQEFANLMEVHSKKSKTASAGMFKGGLADHSEITIKGHTATHLLHQALRDMFGAELHQSGSNITSERVRFDFNMGRNLTPGELKKLEDTINGKIKENLPVHFEMLPLAKAKEIGAIGLFDDKYEGEVKVYFIGEYSKEFCGGPHVDWTGKLKSFTIIKQENLGKSQKRIYAKVD